MHCWFVQILHEALKRLIYLDYWRTKHWKYLILEKDAKADIIFRGTKVCKSEQVRKYFVNPKTEIEVLSYIICSLDFENISRTLSFYCIWKRWILSFHGTYWLSITYLILLRVFCFFLFFSFFLRFFAGSVTCWGIEVS